jgi:SM-20-related protein
LQQVFDTLINSYIDEKIGIAQHFIPKQLANGLRDHLKLLYRENSMLAAGTGNELVDHNQLFRSDVIYWLDRKHQDVHEDAFFDLMDKFVRYLNESCYTSITSYEFHYALYQPGTFYKKHTDQFKTDDSRQFSMIIYLTENWQPGDGGELSLYLSTGIKNIVPGNDHTVFFKSSELEHEVLLTHKPRMSITGWFKK